MGNLNADEAHLDKCRKLVQTYLKMHMYDSALFWADKVVALSCSSPKDMYWLAQCMFLLKQYHRAAHLLRSRKLDNMYVLCNSLTVRCLLEVGEYNDALKVSNSMNLEVFLQNVNATGVAGDAAHLETGMFDDTPRHQVQSSVLLLKGKVLEAMDNRGLASNCYKQALQCDVNCFEAFECLIQHHMLTSAEEEELINSLPINEQCSKEEAEMLLILYKSKLKKYHTPTDSVTEMSDGMMQRLMGSLDLELSRAEQMYYNCNFQGCFDLTEKILKEDPYHSACLPVHVSCLVELKESNKLFTLAHKFVDLYPNLAISWYAVGCYYYIIGRSDCARRYLAKATSLDRLFGPAWLAFGHSFAIENEHDQAMAAYFKASQLMKGCHLPLMYIGLECGLTNNVRLAEKFFQQANTIAPEDPFVLHEMGVIAYQNMEHELAENHFNKALDIIKRHKSMLMHERYAPLYQNLGHALRKQKKYAEALECYHESLILKPQCASTYSSIAFVHALTNNLEESADWFHKALGLRRDDTFSTTMLNYVIEQLAEKQPPFPDAPTAIPDFKKPEVEGGSAVEIIETKEPEMTSTTATEMSTTNDDFTKLSMTY